MKPYQPLSIVFLALLSAHSLQAQPITLERQVDLGLTIYNDNLSLIRDVRTFELAGKSELLAIEGVSAQIKPETVMFRVTQGAPIAVVEQNFDFDLLTPESLLEKYVGEEITLARETAVAADPILRKGRLLSVTKEGRLVFEVIRPGGKKQIEISSHNSPWRIIMDTVPSHLRQRPTLSLRTGQTQAGKRTTELAYLSGGLSWKADYVATLNQEESALALIANVTLTNNSGTTYRDATLQLVAGNVNQVQPPAPRIRRAMLDGVMEMAASKMQEEGLMDYHLYTLQRKTTIANKQTKQVAMFSRDQVAAKKDYLVDNRQYHYHYRQAAGKTWNDSPVYSLLKLKNDQASNLGLPLPRGIVRVYQQDSRGNMQFVGEDRIDHTAKEEEVSLTLGTAFDIKAKRRQLEFTRERSPHSANRSIFTSKYQIVLTNAKDEAVTVKVMEPVDSSWKILKESLPSQRENASTISWQVEIPKNGETRIDYTVRSE